MVVGKRARNVSEAEALDYVCGYTAFNDGSLRDYQRRTTQWTAGKNFDATCPCGSVIVTADELPVGAVSLFTPPSQRYLVSPAGQGMRRRGNCHDDVVA